MASNDWMGGLLTAVGSAGAGAFAGSIAAQKDNFNLTSDMIKMKAIEQREMNMERLRQQFGLDLQKAGFAHSENLQKENLGHTERLQKEGYGHAETMQNQKLKSDKELTLLREAGDTKRTGMHVAAARDNAAETRKYREELANQNAIYKQAMADARTSDAERNKLREKREAIKEISSMLSEQDSNPAALSTAKALAAEHGISLKDEEYVAEKNMIFPDKMGKRTVVDTSLLGSSNSGAQPEQKTGRSVSDVLKILESKPVSDPVKSKSPQSKAAPAAMPDSIGKDQLIGIMDTPQVSQSGAYKTEYKPGSSPSLLSGVQSWASKSMPEDSERFGEGPLEFAIRKYRAVDDLSTLKDMAENLRQQYPNASDDQLADAVMRAFSASVE